MFLRFIEKVTQKDGYEAMSNLPMVPLRTPTLRRDLHGEVFEPLPDLELFRQVKVNEETRTIEWPNGADFAPEFLYEIGREVK
jgi:hypothetical protein